MPFYPSCFLFSLPIIILYHSSGTNIKKVLLYFSAYVWQKRGLTLHIPDGYLGPATYGPFYLLMGFIWLRAGRVLSKVLEARQVPWLALGASFSFIIMMFNIPIPGGSTGHVVGSTLVAILLGPWAAVMALSITLIIQALLFGDGGITTIGVNCFNMAFIMPFTGFYFFNWFQARLFRFRSLSRSKQQILAAGIAGYLSLNLAALFCAIELGLQPLIAHAPNGTPLFSPYPLSVSVPVMAFGHLTFFGFAEAMVTGLSVAYIANLDPNLLKTAYESKRSE